MVTVICWSTAVVLAAALGEVAAVGVGAVVAVLDGAADVGAAEGCPRTGRRPARNR
ncbi:hypothetical protein NKG94_12100 [Micromonospora sp. M12]